MRQARDPAAVRSSSRRTRGAHHHRVAAGDQDIGDLVVLPQILHELIDVLGPRIAGLCRRRIAPTGSSRCSRHDRSGPGPGRTAPSRGTCAGTPTTARRRPSRHVELPSGRPGSGSSACGCHARGCRRRSSSMAPDNHVLEPQKVDSIEHPSLRKGQLVDWIVGNVVPIDELTQHVTVDSERKYVEAALRATCCSSERRRISGKTIDVAAAKRTRRG